MSGLLPKDSFVDLERQRLRLEENVEKLRKSLAHWRNWELEYEGFKEELEPLRDGASLQDMLAAAHAYHGELIEEKEIKELLGERRDLHRSKQQVIDLISRRVDYVTQNARTVEKQLASAEDKLDTLLVVERPQATDEEGLPLTEIVEELDEDDNIISSTTNTPGSTAPQLVEVLKKAGVKNVPRAQEMTQHAGSQATREIADVTEMEESDNESATSPSNVQVTKTPARDASSLGSGDYTNAVESTSRRGDVRATAPVTEIEGTPIQPGKALATEAHLSDNTENNRKMLDPEENTITPTEESPEDAELRRDMLQYGLEEVGAVVAELEMDEDGSEVSYDEEQDVTADSDDEEEDQFGRSIRSVLTDDYRRKMMELEKRLNAKSLENLGPDPSILPDETHDQCDLKPSIVAETKIAAKVKSSGKEKKKVAFAEELDIAPAPGIAQVPPKMKALEEPSANPVQDAVIEKAGSATASLDATIKHPKKASRFKSALPTQPNPYPVVDSSSWQKTNRSTHVQSREGKTTAPPTGKIYVDSVVERSTSLSAEPPDLDDFDEGLHKKEIAADFYKVRNRLIHRQGGFSGEGDEKALQPLPDEAGGPKKVSRFKAARLR